MKPLISVIVPVYNVEPYLKKCVDSIIYQNYENLEIILIDDGSPDNCGKICDEYGACDHRIKVIHKLNGGISDARNVALDLVNGDYIIFVDSDDYLEKNAIELMINTIIANNADMAFFGIKLDSVRGISYRLAYQTATNFTGNDILSEYVKESNKISPVLWGKIYKSNLFTDIRFPIGKIYEDAFMMPRILDKCDLVTYCPEIAYVQNRKNVSITRSSFNLKKLDIIDCSEAVMSYIKDNRPDLYVYVVYRKVSAISSSMKRIIQGLCYFKYREQYKSLRRQLLVEYEKAKKCATELSYMRKQDSLAVNNHLCFMIKYFVVGIMDLFKGYVKRIILTVKK